MGDNGLKIYSLHQHQLTESYKTCDIVGYYRDIAGIPTECTADYGLVVCKNKTRKHNLDSFTVSWHFKKDFEGANDDKNTSASITTTPLSKHASRS